MAQCKIRSIALRCSRNGGWPWTGWTSPALAWVQHLRWRCCDNVTGCCRFRRFWSKALHSYPASLFPKMMPGAVWMATAPGSGWAT